MTSDNGLPGGVDAVLVAMKDRNRWASAWSKAIIEAAKPKFGEPSCSGCLVGGCCKQPIVCTYLDAIPIAVRLHRIGLNTSDLREQYRVSGERMELVVAAGDEDTYDGRCPFLAGEHECTVYEDRPMICRAYWVFGGQRQCVPPAHGGLGTRVCTVSHAEPVGRMLEKAVDGAEEMGRDRLPYIRGIGLAVAVVMEALDGPPAQFWDTVLDGCAMPSDRFDRMFAQQESDCPEHFDLEVP